MSKSIYSLIISSIAGLSTIIGYFLIYLKKEKDSTICKSLAFASGVMISLSLIDLIPNSIILIKDSYNKINTLILSILGQFIGVIISSLIDKKIQKNDNLKLYKLGVVTMFVIMLHNIPEGIVTYITSTNNAKLGLMLAFAIALHNIPEGISICIPIYYSTNSKRKAFIYTLISGISEPIGAFISYLFLAKYINNTLLGIIYSIIAGMMINIGYNELYKESIKYNKKKAIIYFIFGTFIIILNHILFE